MKKIFFSVAFWVPLMILLQGCAHTHEHIHDEPEPASFSPTFWSDEVELFLDFPPLIVGKTSSFAAHFTSLKNFKPLESGKTTIQFSRNGQLINEISSDSPKSPGLWIMEFSPEEGKEVDVKIFISTESLDDTFELQNIPIFSNDTIAFAARPPIPEGDEITFSKEQAWKIDFELEPVKKRPIHGIIHTSGEIQPVKGEEKMVTSKTSGILLFKSKKLQIGREVNAGEILLSISSQGLVQANLDEDFKVAKARLNKTKADFERAEKLLSQEIIGQKEYELRKMDFAIAEAEFQTLTQNYQSGQTLRAPISGILKNILVSDGQFVEEGTLLIEITQNKRLLLHADVSQSHLPKLRNIQSANFKTPYQKEVQSIEKYNGKLVSYGNIIEDGSGFVPVVFELDNVGELIPGSFVELFLLINPTEKALVLPKSALMEDYGSHSVYVQTGGETFEKREVKVGINDGINVQIHSGINEGERVVTKGAYQVKMASMSSAIPAHHH